MSPRCSIYIIQRGRTKNLKAVSSTSDFIALCWGFYFLYYYCSPGISGLCLNLVFVRSILLHSDLKKKRTLSQITAFLIHCCYIYLWKVNKVKKVFSWFTSSLLTQFMLFLCDIQSIYKFLNGLPVFLISVPKKVIS